MNHKIFILLLVTAHCISTKSDAQTFNVGSGGTYATLNDAVTAYNSLTLTQPVTFLLTDAAYSITTPVNISTNTTASSTNTLTIKPAPGVTAAINGNINNDAVLKINGDYITIDGSNNGSNTKSLTISNQSIISPKVLIIGGEDLANTASFITLKNTILINGNNTSVGCSLTTPTGAASGGYFNNITIDNNSIQNSLYGINAIGAVGPFQNGTTIRILNNNLAGTGANAIRNIGISLTGLSFGCTVEGNSIGNFETAFGETDKGIFVSTACSTVVIKNNSISNLQYTGTGSFAPVGIDIFSPGGTNIQVLDNQLSGILSSGLAFTKGIALNGNTTLVNIINNRISNIKNTNASGRVYGVEFSPTSASNGGKLINNFISDIAGTAFTYGIGAIGPGVRQIAFNTVLLTAPSGNSYAFYAGPNVQGRIECRNNNFINRSANAGSSYAILHTNTLTFSGIDNNNFEGNPLGQRSGSNLTTLAEIQSFYGAASVSIPPIFVSATDLHLTTTGNETLDNLGAPVSGIITDIDGAARSSTTPDIGADEFGSVAGASLIIDCSVPSSTVCPGTTFNLNYTVQGGTPAAGNTYTAQLSNSTGSFALPVLIGSVASVAISGTISVTIPTGAAGNFYRIRVFSSTPAFLGNDNGVDLVILKPSTGIITGSATGVIGIANPYSVVIRTGSTYNWTFTDGLQNTGSNSNSVTATFNVVGSQLVSVTETDNNGCTGNTVTKGVAVSGASTTNIVLSGSLTGNYNTLKEAFDAINTAGGSGSITATVVGNTAETVQAKLMPTNYTILIKPQGNMIISGNLDTSLIMLKGADNITINGQSLSGANTLTFRNTSTAINASVIRLEDGSSSNIIRNCIIEGSANGTVVSSGALVINNGTIAGDNLNNIIDGNLIRRSTAGGLTFGIVVGSGNTTTTNTFTGTKITNNLIENVFSVSNLQSSGILLRNNTINTLVKGNSIYNTLPLNNTFNDATYFGIRINSINTVLGTGNIIDSNFIGGTAPGASGAKMVINSPNNSLYFEGIFMNENITAAVSAVTRNIIRNISVESANTTSTSLYVFRGIDIVKANLQQLENNTIGATENDNITIVMKPASNANISSHGILLYSGCTNPIANNFIGGLNITIIPIAGSPIAPSMSLMETNSGVAAINIKKNTLGSSTANNIFITNNSPALFNFYGFSNNNNVAAGNINIDSNTVQNISAVKTNITGIDNYIYSAVPTAASITMNGNSIRDINITGSGSTNSIATTTETSVKNLVQILNMNGNSINNITATSGTGISLFGISILNNSTAVNRTRGSIANNSITNIVNASTGTGGITAGLNYSNDIVINDSMVFSTNNFTNITDAGVITLPGLAANSNAMLIGMNNSNANGQAIIRDNTISGIASTTNINGATRVNGIAVTGNTAIIERNKIFNLQNAATANTARVEAILLRSRSDDGNTSLVRNNMIALNTTTVAQIAGIRLQDAGQKSNIYHNTILTEGSSTTNSYTVLKDAASVADVKNNILYNAITGAGNAFAIGLETNGTGYTGNNNYFVSPATASLAQVGNTSHTLASWQAATTQDAAAQQGQSGVNTSAANLFVDKTSAILLISTANGTELEKVSDKGLGLSASVPTDFLLALRNTSTPDIGAHEFLFTGSGINWTGNVSTEWENASNWGNNQVPNANTKVIIPGGRPRYPIISVSTTVKSISTAPNTSINVAAGVTLLIAGN